MGLQVGNILGAATSLTTALSKEKSLKSFLNGIDDFGLQVANNFEVNFSGLTDITFFITSISIPPMQQEFAELYYNGRKVDIPIVYDFTHEFTLTVLNDASGWIYPVIQNFIMSEATNVLAQTGYTMTIKALTGDKKYKGTLLTLNNVRLESISGLDFGYDNNNIQTFEVGCKLLEYTSTPGALGMLANAAGIINSLAG